MSVERSPVKDVFVGNIPSRDEISANSAKWLQKCFGMGGRAAWDETAVLVAVRGIDPDHYRGDAPIKVEFTEEGMEALGTTNKTCTVIYFGGPAAVPGEPVDDTDAVLVTALLLLQSAIYDNIHIHKKIEKDIRIC